MIPATDEPFRLKSIALPAFGPTIVNAVGHGAVLPVVALQARDLGGSIGLAAFVVALVGLGQLVNSLPAGALVARIGERRSLAITGVIEAVAMVAAALATSVFTFAIAIFVTGCTWTVFLLARQGFIIDAVPVSYRARALSTLGGSHRIGLVVGPLLGAGVIALAGLPWVFALGALMSLAAALMSFTMPDLGSASRADQRASGHLSVWSVLRSHRRVLVTLGSAIAVISASRAVRLTLLPLWCEHIGMSASETSLVFGIAAFVDATLFYPAGWVMDHYGRTWVAFPVVAAVAVGVLLLPLAQTMAAVLAVAALMAVGNGLGSGIVMTLGADSAPTIGRSQFLGGWRLMGDVGNTTSPLIISAVAAVAPLALACLVTGGLGVLGTGWVTYWVRRFDRARTHASR